MNAAAGQTLGDDLAQCRDALGRTVREHVWAILQDRPRIRAFELPERVRLGGWLPAAEADQVGTDAE